MTRSPLILAGDIGGTKTKLGLFSLLDTSLEPVRQKRFPSAGYPSLGAMIREFLEPGDPSPQAACFGVPGPVHGSRVKPTNLSWGVDSTEIAAEFGIGTVALLNDLAANAHGIAHLSSKDFATLQKGAPDAAGNRCVVSPGTGLGEAGLFWDGKRHHVWACEGGHTDFAPRNELEDGLLVYLRKQFGHVSGERVVSGIGLGNVYRYLRDSGHGKELPEVAAAMATTDHNAVISRYAAEGTCPLCQQTMEMFVGCLAAECGNMALKAMATGGVYLGGGIPVKILPFLQGVGFLHAFNDKGRLTSLMEGIPVRVILNDDAALIGAAHHALDVSTAPKGA